MTPERWQQVKELFQSVVECETSQRAAFLDEACAGDSDLRRELEILLASDKRAENFLEAPVASLRTDQPTESLVRRRIGPYQIRREIARGGMGAVYLAERADDQFQKQVAIKVVKRGMDSDAILRRFRNEQKILANLDHPNIARLIDGGTTEDGLSYFIMDYVEGLPIDGYCDTHQLPTPERLKLFRTVCSAVEYAHQHHVVHRDLKPRNILVTGDGVPRLLDFGIAKVLNPDEVSQTTGLSGALRLMTPRYASPEQVRGEPVTPASDVYSLGVILYELLTGHHPYRLQSLTPQEIERVIREEEPEKPSAAIHRVEDVPGADGVARITLTPESVSKTREGEPEKLRRRLTGDLDNIALMALRKEPERRYASPAQLSEDIRRHLEGRPVLARNDTLVYRSAKFIKRNKAVLIALLVVMIVVGLINAGLYLLRDRTIGKAINSVAVLPLKNLSGDPEQEYFADGMTEALITDLGKIGALRVTSRTSVMRYKEDRKPLPEIARQLKVDGVVEGSVLRSGDRVRITAQLIEAATDQHLWSRSYERDLRDVLALQSEVAQAIAQEIKIKLTPQEQTRLASARPVHREAYDAYLKGHYFWNKGTEEARKRSVDYFNQSIEKDPSYAPAYAGLAESFLALQVHGTWSPREFLPKAKAAAMRAVELDDTLAEARTALGHVKYRYERDLVGAEREYRRAIDINPRYADAHVWYGYLLAAIGQRDASIAEMKQALELEPLSLMIHHHLTWAFYYTGQYDEAIEQARKVIEMDPNFSPGHLNLGIACERKGMYKEAIAELEKAVYLSREPQAMAALGHAYAVSGRKKQAEKMLGQLRELSKRRHVSPRFIALIYVGLGEKEQALEWLHKAYEQYSHGLNILRADSRFDGLRSDPRFADLLRRLGLPP
jgi:eukaryotic-like serine/threonine-protein kinase